MTSSDPIAATPAPTVIGRYALYDEIASGGMASVHYGQLRGSGGFSKIVAVKRLHPQFAREEEFVSMLLDEARLTARIRHPNVVSMTDVVTAGDDVVLVMEYVHGESLARLMRAAARAKAEPGLDIASGVMVPALHGLHAAHSATDETGNRLGVIHRDFTPQNLLVGEDGVPRVVDFGIARAVGRLQTTRDGQIRGKPAYMAPEQVTGQAMDARTDIWAAAVVLWEMLTLRRLFRAENDIATAHKVLHSEIEPPSSLNSRVSAALDLVILKGLERDPDARWQSAEEMAHALEAAVPPATPTTLARWVNSLASEVLSERNETVARVETASRDLPIPEITSTQTSSVAPVQPASRKPLWIGLLLLLLFSGSVLAWSATRNRPSEQAATSATPELTPAATPAETASALPEPATSAAPSPSATPSATPEPTQAATSRPTRPVVKRKKKPAVNCNPPYTVDAKGVRRFKRACL